MAVLGFASEYEKRSFYDIVNPPSVSCIDFKNENGFSFPPVEDVSINVQFIDGFSCKICELLCQIFCLVVVFACTNFNKMNKF